MPPPRSKEILRPSGRCLLLSPIIQPFPLSNLYSSHLVDDLWFRFLVLGFTDTLISNSSLSAVDFQS